MTSYLCVWNTYTYIVYTEIALYLKVSLEFCGELQENNTLKYFFLRPILG